MIQLTLTEQESEQLFNMIDLAVKAGGIQVAKLAVPITDKLMEAVQQSKPQENTDERD